MRKYLLVILSIITSLIFPVGENAASTVSNHGQETVTLQLKWFHQFQFAGYYAAQEKGFYAEEGMDVVIRDRSPDQSVIKQVLTGGAEYGIGDSSILADYANGAQIIALAAIFQHDPLTFISKQTSGIISPYEMIGKRIMFDNSGGNEAPLQALLQYAKLSNNKYTYVKHSFSNQDLIDNKVDVMSAYLTDQLFFFAQKGVKLNIINPQSYGLDFYGDILFTSLREIHAHPGRAERFRRASLKGWQYAMNHPEEIIQIIKHRYSSPLSIEHLRFEANETAKQILPDIVPLGQIDIARLRRISEVYTGLRQSKPLDESQLRKFIYAAPSLHLTAQELAWLHAHPVIRLGIDRDFAPYEWIDAKGRYVGLVADFMELIQERLGITFEIIKDKSWHEILEMAKRSELDMIGAAVKTLEREQYLTFTTPYATNPAVIINGDGHGYVGNLEYLLGKRAAVQKSYFVEELLRLQYPEIQLIEADTIEGALRLLLNNQADAYIGDALSASYVINLNGYTNLRISGQTPYQSQSSVAVTKANPELFAMMQKALNSISKQESNAIVNRWMGLKIARGVNRETLLKYLIAIVSIFMVFSYWVYRLRREVSAREVSETRLVMAQSAAGIGIWDWNFSTNQAQFNSEYYRLLGLKEGIKHTYEDFLAMLHPDDRKTVSNSIQEFSRRLPHKYTLEYRIIRADNGETHWLVSKGGFTRQLDRTIRSTGVLYDITDNKAAEEKLRLTAQIFDTTLEGIMVTDNRTNIIDVNTAFTNITGYSHEEVLGKKPSILKSSHQEASFYADMWRILNQTGHWSGELWNCRKNGEVYPEWLSISAIRNQKNELTHYVGIFSDITLLKQHQKQLEQIAHYDSLTGIPNRVLLVDRLKQALAHTAREHHVLAVCYLDLDGFKYINDTLGHDAGDQVLIEITKRILHTLRGGDTVARIGGDEFVILLNGLENVTECRMILERLLVAISKPVPIENLIFTVTASIGVTFYPVDREEPDILLRHADQAMYISKQSGKNCYHFFDTVQDAHVKIRHEEMLRIEQALNNQEFVLYYQPKVAMDTLDIIGAEALIRWRHPERGLLSPNEFLPMIENSELEILVGKWVIANALKQISEWRQLGWNIEVSINIAASHLQSEGFVESLRQNLRHYPETEVNQLQIEILETVALEDISKIAGLMKSCAQLGVSFALDDFGTGYSSLSYLRRLPADTLKIDQTFIRDMLIDEGDHAIVQGIIALAETFKRTTVAEGVESMQHFKVLKQMGCDIAQGYGIAKPMPGHDILDWRQTWKEERSVRRGF